MKRVALLGCTGSIGTQALEVIAAERDMHFRLCPLRRVHVSRKCRNRRSASGCRQIGVALLPMGQKR